MRVKTFIPVVTISFFLVVMGATVHAVTSPLCGPQALLIVAQEAGMATTLEEINRLAGYDYKDGTTLLGLYCAAKQLGLPVVSTKLSVDRLCTIPSPFIAWVDGNHFLVVRDCSWFGKQVVIEEPPEKPLTITREEFARRWSGECLVFSQEWLTILSSETTQLSSQRFPGPAVEFAEEVKFFGTVERAATLSHVFTFRNVGSDTLRVYARSTCSCTAAVLSDTKIAPGQSGDILVEFDTDGWYGPVEQQIDVRTNDPQRQWVQLTLAATVRRGVRIIPEQIWVGDISKGNEVSREIRVLDSGDGTLAITGIEAPDFIRVEKNPAIVDSIYGRFIPVSLTLTAGNESVGLETEFILHLADGESVRVPVKGNIIDEYRAYPPALFIGSSPPDTPIRRTITLIPTNGGKHEITKIVTSSPAISTKLHTTENGETDRISVVYISQANEENKTESISIYLDNAGEPSLSIPVVVQVSSL